VCAARGGNHSYPLDELQSGVVGSAVLRADPKTGQEKFFFEYTQREEGRVKKKTGSEPITKDTLVGDMVAPYIAAHWDALMKGAAVNFRMIALSRAETVGFQLVKGSETTRDGTPLVTIKMEPTSWIIARLVDPLFFISEKTGAHHILQ
jgi:hypothetical protein